jgi:hypothetical protein
MEAIRPVVCLLACTITGRFVCFCGGPSRGVCIIPNRFQLKGMTRPLLTTTFSRVHENDSSPFNLAFVVSPCTVCAIVVWESAQGSNSSANTPFVVDWAQVLTLVGCEPHGEPWLDRINSNSKQAKKSFHHGTIFCAFRFLWLLVYFLHCQQEALRKFASRCVDDIVLTFLVTQRCTIHYERKQG